MRAAIRAVITFLCLFAGWKLLARASFEWYGREHSDVAIFATVAKGWLNGYRPYIDLFENKAPGIYMMIAASLRLFGDHRLLWWMQAIVTMLFPLAVAVPAYALKRNAIAGMAGFLFGALLSLYVSIKGGPVFIESYAAFAGAIFVGLLATRRYPLTLRDQLLCAIPLCAALAFKEPMFFSIMGGALIVLPSFRSLRSLLLPIGLVTMVGIAALWIFGFLAGYVSVYLPHIVTHHLFHPWGTVGEPMWLRIIDLPRMWENLGTVSAALPWVILMVWVSSGILLVRPSVFFHSLTPSPSPASGRGGLYFPVIGRWLLATLLTALPVGLTGDFYFHHFVFAVPGYVGFFLVCVREWNAFPNALLKKIFFAIFTLFVLFGLFTISTPFGARDDDWRAWAAPRIRAGAILDAVMDRCAVDRYFADIDRPEGVYGFTRHSPYGPIFTQYGRFIGVRQQYLDAFLQTLERAEILLMRTPDEVVQADPATRAFIADAFTEKPWPCAGNDFAQPSPYRILFRAGAR